MSVTETVPVREPATVGVNFTDIVQLADSPKEPGQVFVWLKSPLATMLVIVSAAEPVLVSVIA